MQRIILTVAIEPVSHIIRQVWYLEPGAFRLFTGRRQIAKAAHKPAQTGWLHTDGNVCALVRRKYQIETNARYGADQTPRRAFIKRIRKPGPTIAICQNNKCLLYTTDA